jgi:hypothetical protein
MRLLVGIILFIFFPVAHCYFRLVIGLAITESSNIGHSLTGVYDKRANVCTYAVK